jgi:hypothetical protein
MYKNFVFCVVHQGNWKASKNISIKKLHKAELITNFLEEWMRWKNTQHNNGSIKQEEVGNNAKLY